MAVWIAITPLLVGFVQTHQVSQILHGEPPPPVCLDPMTFRAATVYAGATDYYFSNGAGEESRIRIQSEEIEASGFSNLTAMDETEEGPPGENPAMVGREFQVCLDGLKIRLNPISGD